MGQKKGAKRPKLREMLKRRAGGSGGPRERNIKLSYISHEYLAYREVLKHF